MTRFLAPPGNLFVLVLRLGLLVAASHPSNPHTSISPTDEGVLKVSSVIRSTGEYLQTTNTGDFITLAEGSYPLKLISSTSPPDEGSDKSVRVLGIERDAGELLRTTDELRRGGARDTVTKEETKENNENAMSDLEDNAPRTDNNLGWFLETEGVDVTTVPVVTRLPRPSLTQKPPTSQSRDETPLTLEFLSGDHRLVLVLHPTRDLLAATYTEPADERASALKASPKVCEYQGVVKGVANSWAALTLCGGVRGVVVGMGQELLVEPSPGASSLKDPHRVFSSSLLHVSPGSCGVTTTVQKFTGGEDNSGNSSSSSRNKRRKAVAVSHRERRAAFYGGSLWTKDTTRFVELVLVADKSYYVKYGPNTRERCKAIVNIVNAIYRPLGLVVVLVHIEVWKAKDQFQVTNNFKSNLEKLKEYTEQLNVERPDLNYDNIVLITVVDFDGTTVGFATVGGMCSNKDSVSVVQDRSEELGVVAQTMAHEMGHNLAMVHDEDIEDCLCEDNKCIMSQTGDAWFNSKIGWSSCSKQLLASGFESNSFKCLKNVPTTLVSDSSCGNGVVDPDAGEQCDCGPVEFCDNLCCVAATCRLAVNASCATGSCCDTQTCHLKGEGVMCRAAVTECDLPEYCPPDSEVCPNDVKLRDGTPCKEGKGNCYEGECGSHEGKCQAVWGHGATVANPVCFSKINIKGASYGNCGKSDNSKIPHICSLRDAPCGTLHCHPGLNEEPKLYGSFRYGSQYQGRELCSYILATSDISSSVWLSPDGAKCGENQLCVNQKCQDVGAPEGDCRDGCSGRGVCNNQKHCHCDPGYAPPACNYVGRGGSIDSNPMEPPRRMKPLVDALVSLGLIFLVAVIILFCCWSRIQWWWERTGRPLCLPCCASCIDSCCCPLTTKAIHWILTIRCFKTQKKNVRKEVCQVKEKAKINGEVDLDFKDCSPRTKIWGKADEKLMTEVVTLTPKKSPDIRRNIQLPSRSPVFRHKSAQELDHPTYLQSVSVDSGCIADIEDIDTNITPNSKMSMTSLISVFSKRCSLSSKKAGQNDNQLPRHFERQKSMPLSRFVVDPLVGNRSSRQGSPPPDHMKTAFRRSISSDVTNGRPGWAPLPQPPSNKTYRIDENLQKLPKLADNAFVQSENGNKLVNSSHYGQESVTQTQKKPLMPPRNSSSPPKKVPPTRVAPPPPAPTPAKGDQTKKPSVFLWKGKTGPDHSKLPGTGSDPDTKTKPPRPMHEGKSDAAFLGPSKPTRVPLMPPKTSPPKPPKTSPPKPPKTSPPKPPKTGPPKPPNKGPLKLPNTGPSKSPNTALQPGAKKNVPVPPGKGVSVKDIARRLEQS